MKKLISVTLFLVTMILCFISCGPGTNDMSNSGDPHTHYWLAATCTTPKTCSTCNKTEGEVLEHNYKNGICTMCGESDPISSQIKTGQEVYDTLNSINVITEYIAQSVYNAWYFSIYRSDDDIFIGEYDLAIKTFASYVGLNYDKVVEAIDQNLTEIGWGSTDSMLRFAHLRSGSGAVGTVLRVFKNAGLNSSLSDEFDKVKSLLKEMDSSYEDETYYSILKEYYNSSLTYYEFASNPTGSFNQLSSTLNGHTAKLNEQKNELAFIYED